MATEQGRRSLEGRCAVVTGVGSGLGQAIAREFAAEGALVVGCDVNDAAGEATMDGIGTYIRADVSREAEVEGLVAAAIERHGRLHVMVNNAAVQIEQELAETTEEQLDRILAVNLKGVFFGCKAAIPAMVAGGGGLYAEAVFNGLPVNACGGFVRAALVDNEPGIQYFAAAIRPTLVAYVSSVKYGSRDAKMKLWTQARNIQFTPPASATTANALASCKAAPEAKPVVPEVAASALK